MWPFKRKVKRMSNDEIADVIEATADVMDKNGQVSGRLWNYGDRYMGGPVCLIGAFGVATNNVTWKSAHDIIKVHPAALAITDDLDGGSPFFAMSTFSDHAHIDGKFSSVTKALPGKQIVVDRLRKIANDLRPQKPETRIVEVPNTQNDVELVGGPAQ